MSPFCHQMLSCPSQLIVYFLSEKTVKEKQCHLSSASLHSRSWKEALRFSLEFLVKHRMKVIFWHRVSLLTFLNYRALIAQSRVLMWHFRTVCHTKSSYLPPSYSPPAPLDTSIVLQLPPLASCPQFAPKVSCLRKSMQCVCKSGLSHHTWETSPLCQSFSLVAQTLY